MMALEEGSYFFIGQWRVGGLGGRYGGVVQGDRSRHIRTDSITSSPGRSPPVGHHYMFLLICFSALMPIWKLFFLPADLS